MAICIDSTAATSTAATLTDGVWSCPAGRYILFTPSEFQMAATMNVKPMSATPDDYAAVSAIFGVVLVALCVVWGTKQVLRLLQNTAES